LVDDLRLLVGGHGHAFQRRFQDRHRYGLDRHTGEWFRGGGCCAGVAGQRMVPERHVLVELGHLVGSTAAALVTAALEAERRRTEAQHDADGATAHADGNHAGPDEPELDRLEALLAGAHERDDQAQRHRAQSHVQQRVGRRALLQLVQSPVRAVTAAERQGVVDLFCGRGHTHDKRGLCGCSNIIYRIFIHYC